jgi:adenylosuccinate synthase
MIPNGVVSPRLKNVLIGPGAVINPLNMWDELESVRDHITDRVKFAIHENAAVVTDKHREAEKELVRIGSTMKGTSEAMIHKMRRSTMRGDMNTAAAALMGTPLEPYVVSMEEYNDILDSANYVQVEGAQGFSLSLNHGFYPYVTSRDCTSLQILSDCAIPALTVMNMHITVFGVCRTYPIRVANRFGEDGKQVGYSGPPYPDQEEITWKSIGREPELTTVTKLPRRVFTFSMQQIREAIRMDAPDHIFLNFCNYLKSGEEVNSLIRAINGLGTHVKYLGFGPTIQNIQELP